MFSMFLLGTIFDVFTRFASHFVEPSCFNEWHAKFLEVSFLSARPGAFA